MHAHGSEIRSGNFKLFKTSVGCVRIGTLGHRLASLQADVRRCSKERDVSPNAATAGDTACSVKGV